MIDHQYYAHLILDRLHELDDRMHDIDAELDVPKDADLSEQAIDLEDDDVLETLGFAAQKEAELLHQALKRIADKSYGICLECENPISEKRLQAVPYAPLCKTCAGAGPK